MLNQSPKANVWNWKWGKLINLEGKSNSKIPVDSTIGSCIEHEEDRDMCKTEWDINNLIFCHYNGFMLLTCKINDNWQ